MEELESVNGYRPKEIHVIIIWDSIHRSLANAYLSNLVEQKRILILCQEIVKLEPTIENKLSQILYSTEESRAVNNSIYLIVIEDQNPVYKYEQATSCKQVLNNTMFNIKKDLRKIISDYDQKTKSIYYYVHTSYNTEETELVLRVLNLENKFFSRTSFNSIKDFFCTLNEHPKLKYVVQRSFTELTNINHLKVNDVDVLVNDYYLFKELTGARSMNKILMREREDGYFIQNEIIIENENIPFDIRYLGDNYNSYSFEKDTLATRIIAKINDFEVFVPNTTYHLYTLLYHVLIQKENKPKKPHFETIIQLYTKSNMDINFDKNKLKKHSIFWNDLISFMNKNNYKIVKPKDKNVNLVIPEKYRQLFKYKHQIDFTVEKDNYYTDISLSIKDMDELIPYGNTIIFIDDCNWNADDWIFNHNPIPYIERDGQYWGNPVDDKTAIYELMEHLKKSASHLVLIEASFWWLDYYKNWYKYLRANFSCVLKNERIIIFDLSRK